MKRFLRDVFVVFELHAFRMLRSRRALVMLLLSAVPALLLFVAFRVSARQSPEELVQVITWFLSFMFVVPFVALIGGSAVVAEEIADRTITYVFTRPASRIAFLLGRWAAAMLVVGLVLIAGSLLLRLAAGSRDVPRVMWSVTLTTSVLGGLVYCTLFTAFSARFRHPMVVGVGYVFAFETMVANLPGNISAPSLQHQLRVWVLQRAAGEWRDVAELADLTDVADADPVRVLVGVLVVSLAAACLIIRRREYVT